MRSRLLVVLGLVVASMLSGTAVGAQAGSSLEFEGDRTLRVTSTGRKTLSSNSYRNPFPTCVYKSGNGLEVRAWWIEQKEADGFSGDQLATDLYATAQGPEWTFGQDAFKDLIGGYCKAAGSSRFAGGSPTTWWVEGDPEVDDPFSDVWDEVFDTIDFPNPSIASAPNADTPFLTQLPVGFKPTEPIVVEYAEAFAQWGQLIQVTATPVVIRFDSTVESEEGSVDCPFPFPSDEDLIESMIPGCSLTFVEDTLAEGGGEVTLSVEYLVTTQCQTFCAYPDRPFSYTVTIPVDVLEVIGLG